VTIIVSAAITIENAELLIGDATEMHTANDA
jgi:hypothetical protein